MCIHAQCAKQHEAAIYPRHTATLRSSPCEALVSRSGLTTSLYAAGSCLVQYAHAQCAFIHSRVGPRTTSQQKAPPLGKKYDVSTKSTTSYDTYTTFKNAHYFSNHTASPSKTPHHSRNVHHPSIVSTTTMSNHLVLMKITTSYPFANFGGDHLPYYLGWLRTPNCDEYRYAQ